MLELSDDELDKTCKTYQHFHYALVCIPQAISPVFSTRALTRQKIPFVSVIVAALIKFVIATIAPFPLL